MNDTNCYGDGTVFEGVRSKDSVIPTLQLAIDLEGPHGVVTCQQAATELRRLHEVNRANARLIAAAPSLYEALADLLEQTRQYGHVEEIRAAEIALAKARGDSHD